MTGLVFVCIGRSHFAADGLSCAWLPASGGAVGPESVPGVDRDIAPVLPSHAALLALRGTVYFGGGTTGPILVLVAWSAAAVAAIVAARALRRARRRACPPSGCPSPPSRGSRRPQPSPKAAAASSWAAMSSPVTASAWLVHTLVGL
ncbi:hypothetical protein DSM104299_05082 [Baekduia alba]|uniref:hypothetical protein n=1 Tax=Baekduia alba TaxID=2997333 RepID=UPI002340FB9B|nr:hypothetical protein [Baekduia alba]WCB96325.1 hypothetical protein DSM104299_05082 [Baekduia alba]